MRPLKTKSALLLLLLIPTAGHAFNAKTHVWIGQQVINDVVPDGMVTIPPYGDFKIDDAITSALRDVSYQKIYLMGNVGPDGFPDIVGGQMTTHPGVDNGWQTDDFLRWAVSNTGTNMSAQVFANGYVAHAAADIMAHTYVNTYVGDIFDISDDTFVPQRHILLEKYVSNFIPPLNDSNGNSLSESYQLIAINNELPVTYIRDALIKNSNIAEQYKKSASTKYLWAMNEIRDAVDKLYSEVPFDPFNTLYNSLQTELDSVTAVLKDTCAALPPPPPIYYPCPSFWNPFKVCSYRPDPCDPTKACDLDPGCALLKANLQAINDTINPGLLTLQGRLQDWRNNVDTALYEYVTTSSRISYEIMKPGGDPVSELTTWMSCYGPAFSGSPTCKAFIADPVEVLNNILNTQSSFPLTSEAVRAFNTIEEMKKNIETEIRNTLVDIALKNLREDLYRLADILLRNPTDHDIDEVFSIDGSGKGLLTFNDASRRIKADMHLNESGYLNPTDFAVMYDAVIMAKLSLLSASELNRMASIAGVGNTIYGPTLFSTNSSGPFNILLGAVRSIDGNHQWLDTAPPYPRREGFVDQGWPDKRHYGYAFDGAKGFRLWADPQARQKIFLKIFHGPLVPGIESPQSNGFTAVMPSGYPYMVCKNHPFTEPRTFPCVADWLPSIIMSLLE